jgi:hypothetical protein
LAELLIKREADNNRKGVVGSPGIKIPMIPSIKEMIPRIIKMPFFINNKAC